MTSYRSSQAHRPAPWWLPLVGLAAYALVGAGVVYLALVLLTSLSTYIPSGL